MEALVKQEQYAELCNTVLSPTKVTSVDKEQHVDVVASSLLIWRFATVKFCWTQHDDVNTWILQFNSVTCFVPQPRVNPPYSISRLKSINEQVARRSDAAVCQYL